MPLSRNDAKRIHTVYINPNIKTPDSMFYKGADAGAAFGLLGGVADALVDESSGKRVNHAAKRDGVDIDQIVRDEFIKQIAQNTSFKVINTPNADASMNVIIKFYGLWEPNIFSSGVKPVIDIQANLIDRQGKMIWANADYVTVYSSGMPEYSEESIDKNPVILKNMLSDAAAKSVSNIVETLK